MFNKFKPMTLGDIFNVSIELIRKTFFRNIIIAAVFLIPAGFILVNGMETFFSGVSGITRVAEESVYDTRSLWAGMFGIMGQFFLTGFLFVLGYLAALIGITKIGCSEMDGKRISLSEAFREIFSVTFFKVLLQIFTIVISCIGIIIGVALVISVFSLWDNPISWLIRICAGIAGFVYLFSLLFRWYFAFVSLVHTDNGPVECLRKSYYLVQDYWWRTFWIISLISLVINFGVSIIITPLSFIFMSGTMSTYLNAIKDNSLKQNPAEFFEMLKSISFSFGAIIIFNSILISLLTPLFNIVLYFDLKIRKNEYADEVDETGSLSTEEPILGQ